MSAASKERFAGGESMTKLSKSKFVVQANFPALKERIERAFSHRLTQMNKDFLFGRDRRDESQGILLDRNLALEDVFPIAPNMHLTSSCKDLLVARGRNRPR